MSTHSLTAPYLGLGSSWQLVVLGDHTSLSWVLPERGSFSVGRLSSCDFSIENPTLSRKHAIFHIEPGPRFLIEDQGSANGVRIAGTLIEPFRPLTVDPGVAIEMGAITLFVQRRPAVTRPKLAGLDGPNEPEPIVVTGTMLSSGDSMLDRIAKSSLSVLILGETGVGKDVLAQALHRMSNRAGEKFQTLNCAALPENLIESEIFGHERGAFSGADRAKPGLFEVAHGGTVFLDEVGELPAAAQAKFLRFLESREILRVGALAPRTVDVRIIAATHRQLSGAQAYRGFRQDLYFRLAVLCLWVPPLRERRDEIPALAERFISEVCRKNNLPRRPVLSARATAALQAYSWPGNIRELRNVLDRVTVLCASDTIGPEHLNLNQPSAQVRHAARAPVGMDGAPAPAGPVSASPAVAHPPAHRPPPLPPELLAPSSFPRITPPPMDDLAASAAPVVNIPAAMISGRGAPLRTQISDMEKQQILNALAQCGGNQSRAAELLGISRRTLINRLEEYGVTRPRKGRNPAGD